MYKFKCSCGHVFFSDYEDEQDCEMFSDEDKEDDEGRHFVSRVKTLNSEDYISLWESDLEGANRHSLMDMPRDVFDILNKKIKEKPLVRKIMKELYEKQIGID